MLLVYQFYATVLQQDDTVLAGEEDVPSLLVYNYIVITTGINSSALIMKNNWNTANPVKSVTSILMQESLFKFMCKRYIVTEVVATALHDLIAALEKNCSKHKARKTQ